jgi:hypothetical protein
MWTTDLMRRVHVHLLVSTMPATYPTICARPESLSLRYMKTPRRLRHTLEVSACSVISS